MATAVSLQLLRHVTVPKAVWREKAWPSKWTDVHDIHLHTDFGKRHFRTKAFDFCEIVERIFVG